MADDTLVASGVSPWKWMNGCFIEPPPGGETGMDAFERLLVSSFSRSRAAALAGAEIFGR